MFCLEEILKVLLEFQVYVTDGIIGNKYVYIKAQPL